MKYISTKEAAERLGVTRRRVVAMIKAGSIKTVKVGRIHLIDPGQLDKVQDRTPGRPKQK